MEDERSLARGLAASGSVNQQNYKNALSKLEDSLKDLNLYSSLINQEDLRLLDDAKEKLTQIMPKQTAINIEGGNYTTNFEYGVKKHFKSIHIKNINSLKISHWIISIRLISLLGLIMLGKLLYLKRFTY